MANYFARANGNINATNVWATTPSGTASDVWSTFTSEDVLHSNNFAITVNVSTTVATVRNDNANSATSGGSFTLSNGVTLTANVIAGASGTGCLFYGGNTPNSATLIGNAQAGATVAVANQSNGTLNITGNCTAGTASNSFGANNQSNGTLNITGNCTGGSGGTGSVNGANNASTGTLNITGNCTGGSVAPAFGANNNSTGTLNITGNCTGGSIASAFGAHNNSAGTITIIGSAIASNNAIGTRNTSTGILTVTRAVGNGWGIGTTGIISVAGVESSVAGSQTRVEEFEVGALGQFPAAGSVALGVAVDNTVGTSVLTQSAVWDALVSGMTTSGSIGARLKNAATIESTGQQLADALSPVP
jgi:hypothetical protein